MTTRYVCLAAAAWLLAAPVRAQQVDIAGVRARGMAGAFTAVADDASATWWNPAGLAAGPYFDGLVELDRTDEPRDPSAGPRPPETRVAAFAASIPSLGFGYYHFRISEIRGARATAAADPSRQDPRRTGQGVLAGDQFGVTVGQSFGDHLVVATTLKLLRGAIEGADASTAATLDVGAIASVGAARFGIAVRDLTEPTLGSGPRYGVARQVRAGAAVVLDGRGAIDAVTIAADADLATRELVGGDEREVSGGAEIWLATRRIGLRGGFSAETVGAARPSASGGVSVAVRTGLYVEASVTRGDAAGRRGWAGGLRVTF